MPERVTIVTVAYNSAATIADTLASVECQSWPDIEHIVVDGGSDDGTDKIVGKAGRVSRFVSEPDRGIYDAMNKGLRMATGGIVGFLNADDVLASPDAIAKLSTAIGERDAVYADLAYVSGTAPCRVVRYWRSGAYERSRLVRGWMPPHPTFYARTGLLRAAGGFDASMRIAADYDLMVRCLGPRRFTVAYVPEVIVHMRLGGASNRSMAALLRKSREDLRAIRRNDVGGVMTLAMKNLRKIPQFFGKVPDAGHV
jgi:glycosyltransferase